MGVVMTSKKEGYLQCERCGKTSGTYQATSPAAPELTICEAAHKEVQWGFTVGFFSMMAGPQTLCAECAQGGSK
jgi:hypothetical protein